MEKTFLLNVPISITNYDEVLKKIKESIINNTKFSIVSINLNKIILSNEDKAMKETIKSFDCFIPDGVSIVKNNEKIKERITGIDLFEKICENHRNIKAKIFLYGASNESVNNTKKILENKYKDINIVGTENGYIKNNEELINKINCLKPNIVIVALGSPKQEKWIYLNKNKINANVFMGVGGAFDVIGGKVSRAPVIIRKIGLEWLYRIIREPKRMKQLPLQIKYWYILKKKKDVKHLEKGRI